jgi:ABC-2 type transport system permease protein
VTQPTNARRHAFAQLILARVREFYREPEVLFWVYGFPLILATVLGLAFSKSEPTPPTVDVVDKAGDKRAEAIVEVLKNAKMTVALNSEEVSRKRFKNDKIAMIVMVENKKELDYLFDPAKDKSQLARYWVDSVLVRSGEPWSVSDRVPAPINEVILTEPGTRYIDFLLPGLIGMNIMGGGLFGVGFVLVDMRVRKLFKRLLATPMHRGDFLFALLTARMFFLLPEMLSLILVGWLAFSVPVQGSMFTLLVVILLGAFAFSGVGLLLGCRTEKTESIQGLINLVMLPMYLLSGIFFSSDRFPDALQPFIKALPLTQLNDALREVMLDGAGLLDIAGSLGILAAWAVITFTLALRWFRWK